MTRYAVVIGQEGDIPLWRAIGSVLTPDPSEFEHVDSTDPRTWLLGPGGNTIVTRTDEEAAYNQKYAEIIARRASAIENGIPITVGPLSSVIQGTNAQLQVISLVFDPTQPPVDGLLIELYEGWTHNGQDAVLLNGEANITAVMQQTLDHVSKANKASYDARVDLKALLDGGATEAQILALDVESYGWPSNVPV